MVTMMHKKKLYPVSSEAAKKHRLFPSVRLFNFLLLFLGSFFISTGQSTFNFTLVCMVNSSALEDTPGNYSIPSECQGREDSNSGKASYQGDIFWSRSQQGNILAAYSWAMVIFTFPAGILIDKIGVKPVYLAGQVILAISVLLTPLASYGGEWWAFAARFGTGLSGGFGWPCIMAIVYHWAPATESSTLTAIGGCGFPVGSILGNLVAGLFCSFGPGHWVSTYYLWGSLTALWCVVFAVAYKNSPDEHNYVTQAERDYIVSNRKVKPTKLPPKIPWRSIATSTAVYATITSNFAANWASYFVADFIPTYIKEVLYLDTTTNGIFSAIPYVTQFAGRMTFGALSDRLNCLGRTATVKIFDAIALGVPALMFICLTFLPCQFAYVAVFCFALGHFAISCNIAGYIRSTTYIAPQYVGVISGIGTTSAAASSLFVPYVVGAIATGSDPTQWKLTLYISAAVLVLGVVNFLIFGTGQLQKWADNEKISTATVPTVSANIQPSHKKENYKRFSIV